MSRGRRKAPSLGGAVVSARVALRRCTGADIDGLAWFEDGQGLPDLLERARADPALSLMAITAADEERPIGVLAYRAGRRGGWLEFDTVAVAPDVRGLGLDAEAVRLAEAEALQTGRLRRFRAAVDPAEGLAFYFWLRLGYRPVRPADEVAGGGGRGGGFPMLRLSDAPGAVDVQHP